MSTKQRIDVDEVILTELRTRGNLSPEKLKKACKSKRISRATYFRHKKKLIKLRQIEEIRQNNEEGKPVKKTRYVGPNELATQRHIEYYLTKIEDQNEEIRNRALDFLYRLSESYRLAWYFSPRSNPKFESYKDVKHYFQNKLLGTPVNVQLKLLNILEMIVRKESHFSLWRLDLIKSCRELLMETAKKEGDIKVRNQALKVLILMKDVPLVDLGLHLLIEPIDDTVHGVLFQNLGEILIKSEEAKTKKLLIRDKLDELSLKNKTLKARVNKLLQGAPP